MIVASLMAALIAVFVAVKARHRAFALLPIALLTADLVMFADGFHAFIPREQAFQPSRSKSASTNCRRSLRFAARHGRLCLHRVRF